MMDRTRWSAIGAAVAITLAGGVALPSASAIVSSGSREVFISITPCRLFDTRPAPATVGTRAAPLGPAESFSQPVVGTNGNCTIPADATAVAMNVTIVNPNANSFLTVWPADAAQPLASNINWSAGAAPIANKVDVKLSAAGAISLFNNGGTVDVLADVVGYYADHNHDDRYYTKAEIDANDGSLRTDVYSRSAMQSYQPVNQQFLPVGGSCISRASADMGNAIYSVPLILPVGSRLVSVDVATFDQTLVVPVASVALSRTTLSATSSTDQVLASGTGSNGPAVIDHDVLVPAITETVDATESFYVQLTGIDNGNGFCGLTVTYDTDG